MKSLLVSQQAVLHEAAVSPVRDADGCVHGEESQELFVQHLVDAAFPHQKQLGEATESGVCNSGSVGDSHWCQLEHRVQEDERAVGQKASPVQLHLQHMSV